MIPQLLKYLGFAYIGAVLVCFALAFLYAAARALEFVGVLQS